MATNKSAAISKGIILALTFMCVLVTIFLPIFGQGRNGLQFSDDLFNKLSKGSSYFIPKLRELNNEYMATNFKVEGKAKSEGDAQKMASLAGKVGLNAASSGETITVSGNLGKFVSIVIEDADAMYHNNGKKLAEAYSVDEKDSKKVLKTWWDLFKIIDFKLKQEKMIKEAKLISEVSKKGLEPAYNYYGIQPQKIADRLGIMIGLLIFYVVYTMWWGFAIMFIFEGIGLSMKKAKVKKEV